MPPHQRLSLQQAMLSKPFRFNKYHTCFSKDFDAAVRLVQKIFGWIFSLLSDGQEIRHNRSVYISVLGLCTVHCAVVSSLEYFEDGLCVAL